MSGNLGGFRCAQGGEQDGIYRLHRRVGFAKAPAHLPRDRTVELVTPSDVSDLNGRWGRRE